MCIPAVAKSYGAWGRGGGGGGGGGGATELFSAIASCKNCHPEQIFKIINIFTLQGIHKVYKMITIPTLHHKDV